MAMFPSSPEEFALNFDGVIRKKENAIEKAEADIARFRREIAAIQSLAAGETQKQLRAMDYTELSQDEYNASKGPQLLGQSDGEICAAI